jgi:hypothetical protein
MIYGRKERVDKREILKDRERYVWLSLVIVALIDNLCFGALTAGKHTHARMHAHTVPQYAYRNAPHSHAPSAFSDNVL